MTSILELLTRETVVSVSDLQRNTTAALSKPIVRITRNGSDIGVFFSSEQLEEISEELDMLAAIDEVRDEPLLSLKEARTQYRKLRRSR